MPAGNATIAIPNNVAGSTLNMISAEITMYPIANPPTTSNALSLLFDVTDGRMDTRSITAIGVNGYSANDFSLFSISDPPLIISGYSL